MPKATYGTIANDTRLGKQYRFSPNSDLMKLKTGQGALNFSLLAGAKKEGLRALEYSISMVSKGDRAMFPSQVIISPHQITTLHLGLQRKMVSVRAQNSTEYVFVLTLL